MGDLAHEVGERDRNRDDRLLDPVILQENGLCGDVAAGLPKHAAEHEATGSRLALGLALIVAGGLLSGSSIFLMGRAWRMGLDPDNRTELAENGPYRWIRHPIYSGWAMSAVWWKSERKASSSGAVGLQLRPLGSGCRRMTPWEAIAGSGTREKG